MTRDEVWTAFFGLVSRYIPLYYGKMRVYVSPEANPFVPEGASLVTFVDVNLYGLEMRVEDAR